MSDTHNKIRKLLALAQSSNPHEAALAAERAQALLVEHRLTLADLQQLTPTEIDEPISDEFWRGTLINAVGRSNGCEVIFASGGGLVRIVGPGDLPVQVQTFYRALAAELLLMARRGWRKHERDLTDERLGRRHPALDEEGARALWCFSFLTGAADIVARRLMDATDRTRPFSKTALLRLAQADEATRKHVEAKYRIEHVQQQPKLVVSKSGLAHGQMTGRDMDLGGRKRLS